MRIVQQIVLLIAAKMKCSAQEESMAKVVKWQTRVCGWIPFVQQIVQYTAMEIQCNAQEGGTLHQAAKCPIRVSQWPIPVAQRIVQ